MPLILLVRHALTEQTGRVLYGRAEGIPLSDEGFRQVERLVERLAPFPVEAVYSSPLERCAGTAEPIARSKGLEVRTDDGLLEGDVGEWTGLEMKALRRLKEWRSVQHHPSTFRFPAGESFVEYQARAVAAVQRIAEAHAGVVVAVTHGDTVRLLVSHHAGAPLDHFQRIVAAPASVSALHVPSDGGPPAVLRVNDTGSLDDLVPRPRRRRRSGRAVGR